MSDTMPTPSPTAGVRAAGHVLLPQLIAGETRQFVHDYALKKAASLTDQQLLDKQVPGTPAFYGDAVLENLMLRLQPAIERATGLSVHPTYAYGRVYKRGDVLQPHRDREACELTVSVNLGTVPDVPWPLWIEGDGDGDGGGVAIDLAPGDAVLFRGVERTHWRDRFTGERAVQVFLHYVDQHGPYREWKFDKRDALSCAR